MKFHPEKPLPFYVRDYHSFTKEEMVAWVEQELGPGEDLAEFASQFKELFPGYTEKYQTARCLALYPLRWLSLIHI